MKELLGGLGVILAFVIYIPYFRDILRRKTTPHPYSWLVWGVTSSIGAGLVLSQGGGPGAWPTVATAFICFTVMVLSLLYEGHQHIRRIDTAMLFLAAIALVLWYYASEPFVAALLLITTDVIGVIPTMRKAWKHPRSETLSLWSLSILRHIISLLALASYNAITVLTPLVWIGVNGVMSAMLLYRRKRVHERNRRHTAKTRRTRARNHR